MLITKHSKVLQNFDISGLTDPNQTCYSANKITGEALIVEVLKSSVVQCFLEKLKN